MKHLQRFFLLLILLAAAGLATAVFAAGPTGAGPNDALLGTDAWQTLAPNASLWFAFDYSGDRSRIWASLDDNAASNVVLAIFTPAQAQAWLNDPKTAPVGYGTKPGAGTSDAVHDLVWMGTFNAPGRYFAVVTNNNSTPVSFRLLIHGDSTQYGPTMTPTPRPVIANPFATPVPQGTLQGRLIFQVASGSNIYTVNGDGTNLTRITYGMDPAWSPDGKHITFARWDASAGVFTANADGTNEQEIFGVYKPLSPQWSPDGTRIAYVSQKGGTLDDKKICFYTMCFNIVADPHWKIGVIDLDTRTLTEPRCSYHCFSPTWSTDNHTIAFADATFGILTTDTLTSADPVTIFSQNPAVQSTLYSPDGSKIAFQVRQANHWEINVMNADGSFVTPVTFADPFASTPVNNVAPRWSPDGKQILFLSDRNGKWEFFVVNVDGTGLKQVLKNVTDLLPIWYNNSNERVVDWIQ
ncbi:MAG: hypothetical protein M1482_06100 [Chloroflexi bacterium]|nr:hypothetical protein [Chloroflexota bacterium]